MLYCLDLWSPLFWTPVHFLLLGSPVHFLLPIREEKSGLRGKWTGGPLQNRTVLTLHRD